MGSTSRNILRPVCRRAVQNGFAPLGLDMLYDPVLIAHLLRFFRNQPLPEGVRPPVFLPRPLVFVSFRAFSALSDAVGPLSSLCQSGFPCANFYVPSNVQMPQNLRLSRKRLPAHFDGLRNDVGLGVFRFIFRKSMAKSTKPMAKSMFFIQFSEYSLHEL